MRDSWVLLVGLALFIGAHAVRLVAPAWRDRWIADGGAGRWKIAFSLVSAVGLGLIALGYAMLRGHTPTLWQASATTRSATTLLMFPAIVLLAASVLPRHPWQRRLGHPMLFGFMLWAFAHLLSNGRVADLLMFGGLLAWAVVAWRALLRRPKAPQAPAAAGVGRPMPAALAGLAHWWGGDAAVMASLLIGVLGWTWLVFGGHARLFGMPLTGVAPG